VAVGLSPVDLPGSAELTTAPLPQGKAVGRDPGQVAVGVSFPSSMSPAKGEGVVGSPRTGVGSIASPTQPFQWPALPRDTGEDALIRPLSLAPSESSAPATDLWTPPPRPSSQAANTMSPGSNAPANSVIVAAPVTSPMPNPAPALGGQGSQAPLIGIAPPAGGNLSGPTASNNVPAMVPQGANGHPVTSHGGTNGHTGAIQLEKGYTATGGGSKRLEHARGAVGAVHPDTTGVGSLTQGSGSGISGAGSGSTNGSGTVSAQSQASKTSSTGKPGQFSFTTQGPFGLKTKYTGTVSISTLGSSPTLVGGSVVFTAMATAPGPGSWTITNVAWGSQGSVPMYSSQTYPVSAGKFNNTPYQLGGQTGSTVGWYWGENPGDMKITATATVKNTTLNKTLTATEASITLTVNGDVIPDTKAAVVYPYGTSIKSRPSPANPNESVNWLSLGSDEPGEKHGISWAGLQSSHGQLSVVQIINSGTATKSSNATPPLTIHSFVDDQGNPAPFPLVDVAAAATSPFYGGTYDSPGVPLDGSITYHATMNESFTDYVMFKPQGGIWVPVSQFSWTVNAKADWNKGIIGGSWKVTDVTKVNVTPNPVTFNRSWPTWTPSTASGKYTYWDVK
jgi:hypothetical protein